MTTFCISGHAAVAEWLAASGQTVDQRSDHLDMAVLQAGDVVIGRLAIDQVIQVCALGAHYLHLAFAHREGPDDVDWTQADLLAWGARLETIEVGRVNRAGNEHPLAFAGGGTCPPVGPQVHVTFVSDQLTPVYLPVQQFLADIRHVELLATPRMGKQAKLLADRLLSLSANTPLSVHIEAVGDCHTYQEQSVAAQRAVRRLTAAYPEACLVANLTAGTKTMALALKTALGQAAADGVSTHSLYTNTDNNVFEWLDAEPPTHPLTAQLDMRSVLALQGYEVVSRNSDDPSWQANALRREALTQLFFQPPLRDRIAILNSVAMQARSCYADEPRSGRPAGENRPAVLQAADTPSAVPFHGDPQKTLGEQFLRIAAELGLLQFYPASHSVQFANFEVARYCSGLWLEEWAWLRLRHLGIYDLACGVQVSQRESRTKNEFDLVAVHNNRMLVIECKTSTQDAGQDGRTANALYKIESLSDHVARLHGTRVLLVAGHVSNAALARASAGHVSVLALGKHQPKQGTWAVEDGEKSFDCLPPRDLVALSRAWVSKGSFSRDVEPKATPYLVDPAKDPFAPRPSQMAEQLGSLKSHGA